MRRAYVLMTAMPPTKGHMHLIQFAARVGSTAEVVVATQPGEPFEYERVGALQEAAKSMPNVNIHHVRRTLPQEPEQAEGFWDMWLDFLTLFGLQTDDYIVASEMYGKKLAEISNATFIPYDLDRSIYWSKATEVRYDPEVYMDEVLPEFQRHLRFTTTIFGAESCGKTTIAKGLARQLGGWFLPEWSRPYQEAVGPDLNRAVMENIWVGQRALQDSGIDLLDKAHTVQDTDLYSTVGYWNLHAQEYGAVPLNLLADAHERRSDLYIIARSNIPFEADPLRYGGDQRESDDSYWISLAERYELPYVVLENAGQMARLNEAKSHVRAQYPQKISLHYDRITADSLREGTE